MTDNLHFMQLTELAVRLEAREISPVEVTQQQLSRIAALDEGRCNKLLKRSSRLAVTGGHFAVFGNQIP
jgi:Asp-tRNA(Asn)/Glu-tRNA(Gln) amidotransferase A subunit family amidase